MITLQKILHDRNITIPDHEFDASLLPDIEQWYQVLMSHIQQNHNIWILWDFDTDGITATSIFVLWLKAIFPQINIFYRVPERQQGHGLNKENIDYMYGHQVKLILTCDNASNDQDMITYARSKGIECIVTDHHQVTHKDFDYILINPEREDSKYPFKHICWCTVVYKFLQYIQEKNNSNRISDKLWKFIKQMVCIATIVDMVRLESENLYIVTNFRTLFEDENQSPFITYLKEFTEYNRNNGKWFWWKVGPLFNGAWRLEKSNMLISCIINQWKISNLRKCVWYFIELNSYRKKLTKYYSDYIKKHNLVIENDYIVIVRCNELLPWLRRLIGNEYLQNKICFCWGENPSNPDIIDTSVSNSYRINIIDFLRTKHYTVSVWWHYWAFWYSYYKQYQDEFIQDVTNYIQENTSIKEITYDYVLQEGDITMELCDDITSFIWWVGLAEPVFHISWTFQNAKLLSNKYSKYTIIVYNQNYSLLDWKSTPFSRPIDFDNLLVTMETNIYNNKKTIQFTLL